MTTSAPRAPAVQEWIDGEWQHVDVLDDLGSVGEFVAEALSILYWMQGRLSEFVVEVEGRKSGSTGRAAVAR